MKSALESVTARPDRSKKATEPVETGISPVDNFEKPSLLTLFLGMCFQPVPPLLFFFSDV
jgi:hypothetical protein